MPVDYYPNKSLEELEGLLTKLQDRQVRGGITQVSVAGVNTVRALGMGQSKPEIEMLRVLYSLFLRAKESKTAEIIAKWPNPYAQRITRTRARYTLS